MAKVAANSLKMVSCRRGKNSADQKAIFDLQWQAKHSVNNVAPCTGKPAVDYTAQESFWHISTNPEPSFHFSQLAYPLLEASGAGIMFISSVAGIVIAVDGGLTVIGCKWD
nr:tropinone reductase homolog At1g07440-like [Coffea arabica]